MSSESNGPILREAIRQYFIMAHDLTIRVWREHNMDARPPQRDADVQSILNTVEISSLPPSKLAIAQSILSLDRVNAVEVKDCDGAGEVLYKCQEVVIDGHKFTLI